MSNKKNLDEVIHNLKQLVILYGEVTDELISNLEENNRIIDEANKDIDRLHEENKKLVNDYNSLQENYNNLGEENNKKIAKIAELKQKKAPSIEIITNLMRDLQDMLMKANKQNVPQDSDEDEGEEKSETLPVFDLSKDKASDEDGFNLYVIKEI